MKKLFLLIMILALTSCTTTRKTSGGPFTGRTHHKTIKKMTYKQVRQSMNHKTLYIRKNGKVIKNL